jgi:hypothetical protein
MTFIEDILISLVVSVLYTQHDEVYKVYLNDISVITPKRYTRQVTVAVTPQTCRSVQDSSRYFEYNAFFFSMLTPSVILVTVFKHFVLFDISFVTLFY